MARTECRRGFTLIELLVTLAILALLASLALPVAQIAVQRAQEAELRRNLREIRDAIDAYKQAWDDGRIQHGARDSGYPATLSVLVAGVTDALAPKGPKLYFLRRLPRDPMADKPALSAEQTWLTRSHASDPDSPQPGEDVFDVFSSSSATGLDGRPYRQW
ncbi:type II secretion system protein [Niveibacterium terrae]|uniref:type II secretion system protein n=1 Tax=Niveibacterium terrae TaxID=3373598 RepID=UPI003A8D1A0C